MAERKPVQIIAIGESVVARCNDGTIWELSHDGGWDRYASIPQPEPSPAEPVAAAGDVVGRLEEWRSLYQVIPDHTSLADDLADAVAEIARLRARIAETVEELNRAGDRIAALESAAAAEIEVTDAMVEAFQDATAHSLCRTGARRAITAALRAMGR